MATVMPNSARKLINRAVAASGEAGQVIRSCQSLNTGRQRIGCGWIHRLPSRQSFASLSETIRTDSVDTATNGLRVEIGLFPNRMMYLTADSNHDPTIDPG